MPFPKPAATAEHLRRQLGSKYRWLVLSILGLGTVAGVLCTSSFNVAVPALSRHFGLGQDQVQWAMTGFLAAMTIGMLPTSWLLDRLGFRRVFLLALATLMLASVAGFFAPTFSCVVVARILQGAATGVLQPLATLALMRLFPPEIQGRASGIMIFCIALTPAVAPTFGGLLLDYFGWEAIFLLGLPFALVAGLAAIYCLPAPSEIKIRPFDWAGLGWLSLCTLALVEAVSSLQHSGWSSPWTLGQTFIAVASALLYAWHAQRRRDPLINLGLFGHRTFALGTLVAFVYGFGLFASTYLIPVFLQNALAYSASAAGLALLPSGIAMVVTLPVAGRMADDYAPKWITFIGLLLFAASFLLLAVQAGDIHYWEIILATALGRIGLGMIYPALSLAALRHIALQHLGQASVVFNYARQLGGVMGVAIMAVFLQWRETVYGTVAPGIYTAYAQGFIVLTAVIVAAAVAALFMQARRSTASG